MTDNILKEHAHFTRITTTCSWENVSKRNILESYYAGEVPYVNIKCLFIVKYIIAGKAGYNFINTHFRCNITPGFLK